MREMDASGSGQSQVVNYGTSDILTAVAIKITAIGGRGGGDTIRPGRNLPTFRRNILPPSSGEKI